MKSLKNILVGGAMAVCMCAAFSSCYDDKADIVFYLGNQLIDQAGTCTNVLSEVTIYTNGVRTHDIGIAYGKGSYQAVSSNADVVKVKISGDRLQLIGIGNYGSAVVTVTDEKGNQAKLNVVCGEGIRTYQCQSTDFFAMDKDNNLLTDLHQQVADAMAGYQPIKIDGTMTLIPDSISIAEHTEGKFTCYADANADACYGTYVEEKTESGITFTFILPEEQHVFQLGGSISQIIESNFASREHGIFPIYLLEDVTERFQSLNSGISLPEGAKVYFVVKTNSASYKLNLLYTE